MPSVWDSPSSSSHHSTHPTWMRRSNSPIGSICTRSGAAAPWLCLVGPLVWLDAVSMSLLFSGVADGRSVESRRQLSPASVPTVSGELQNRFQNRFQSRCQTRRIGSETDFATVVKPSRPTIPGWNDSTSCSPHKSSPPTWTYRSTPCTGGGTEGKVLLGSGSGDTSGIEAAMSTGGFSTRSIGRPDTHRGFTAPKWQI